MTTFPDINKAYQGMTENVMLDGDWVDGVTAANSITTNFGGQPKGFKELRGASFTITDPRRRLLTHPKRQAGERFAVANFVWMLAGRDDHAFIGQYNQKGAGLAVDGHYPGSHGRRIGPQLQRCIDLLNEDPSTRRAVLLVSREEDLFTHSRDIPCVLSLQFFRRGGKLEMIVHMRSQNLLHVWPYDFYAFSMVQEVVASCLGIDVGPVTTQVSSLHFFEDDLPLVKAIMTDWDQVILAERMETMPKITDLTVITHSLVHPADVLMDTGKPYWETLRKVLA